MSTIKVQSVLSLLMLIACSVVGLAAPSDVKGWQETYWGMTRDQVEGKYGKNDTTPYSIRDYKIFGANFSVDFLFRNRQHLNSVQIREGCFPCVDYRPSQRELAEKIKASLISKYGDGEILEDSHRDSMQEKKFFIGSSTRIAIRWVFPSTIIKFDFREIEPMPQQFSPLITIDYEENEQSKL